MPDIYEQHERAFPAVAAFVIAKDGKRVATIAIKHGGRVWAYVHWIGCTMTRGSAGGGGYDRTSAAIASAIDAHKREAIKRPASDDWKDGAYREAEDSGFVLALEKDGGDTWSDRLRKAGFDVWQAV
jgi:hypothetical protein